MLSMLREIILGKGLRITRKIENGIIHNLSINGVVKISHSLKIYLQQQH